MPRTLHEPPPAHRDPSALRHFWRKPQQGCYGLPLAHSRCSSGEPRRVEGSSAQDQTHS